MSFQQLWPNLASSSPLATLFSSLIILPTLAVIYAIAQRLRRLGGKQNRAVERLIRALCAFDRTLVRTGSWIVGSRVAQPWLRRLVMLLVFAGIALAGASAPWPWCLWVLALGLISVFVVFRHWSHRRSEVGQQLRNEDKEICISGDLSTEMIGACAFVFIYAPIAFAQMQAAGY